MSDSSPKFPELEPMTRPQVLVAMGVTAFVLLLVARIWMSLGTVSILPIQGSWINLGLGVALGLGITLASAVVYQLWPSYRSAANQYLKIVLKPLIWADLIWLGLLPGLSEELLFRGVMLAALGLNISAVIISSLCFGVLHLGGKQQWPYVIWASAVGGVFGYTAIATQSLLIPVVAHIVTNLLAGIIWKLRHPQSTTVGKS